jgi:catechol 2,3-dioxygenase-like lactoylglutathione lyase family enzyme
MLQVLDHVNIRTANLVALRRFYADVLGLKDGARPPFTFGGAWLYCGERAAVHLVEVGHLVEIAKSPEERAPRIEHFAFRASGLADFLDRLRRLGIGYGIALVPGSGNRQVNVFDPDGNHIEIQFAAEEDADLTPFTP